MLPALPLLLSFAFQDEPIGWRCGAEHAAGGRSYEVERAIEGEHRFPASIQVSWTSGSNIERSVEWNYGLTAPPDAPRVIYFTIPMTRRKSRATLRVVFPDSTERLLDSRMDISRPADSGRLWIFQSLDGDVNRALWSARNFRAVLEDRRGRLLGSAEISFPDPAEVAEIVALLNREVDEKLNDPADPANECSAYGAEAYIDPI